MIRYTDEQFNYCNDMVAKILDKTDTVSNFFNMDEMIGEVYADLLTAKNRPAAKTVDWPIFDNVTGGLRPKEFSIFCGATGTGKTEFLVNLSTKLIKQAVPHIVWSVETGCVDYATRLMGALAGEDFHGEGVDKKQLADFETMFGPLLRQQSVLFSPHENRIGYETLMRDLIFANKYHGAKVAILDNLNFFLEVTTANNAIIETDKVIHNLIILSKAIDMHLIMVMHPRKTENGRVESEFDIKGSSTAVQEAHNVFLFNRLDSDTDAPYGVKKEFCREIKLAKMRRRGSNVGKKIMFFRNKFRYEERSLANG